MELRFTNAAVQDLTAIYRHGNLNFGQAQADAYLNRFRRALDFISDFPLAQRERDEMRVPMRVHRAGRHMILYRAARDHVLIVRIRHGREDWRDDPAND